MAATNSVSSFSLATAFDHLVNFHLRHDQITGYLLLLKSSTDASVVSGFAAMFPPQGFYYPGFSSCNRLAGDMQFPVKWQSLFQHRLLLPACPQSLPPTCAGVLNQRQEHCQGMAADKIARRGMNIGKGNSFHGPLQFRR